jgi:hypothetical protein
MDYHHHARLTLHARELLCRAVVDGRYRERGKAGLADRS